MKNRGKFIVFEGTDGSGKSTHMRLLGDFLRERVPCHLTQEPSDSPIGTLIRFYLAGKAETTERSMAALFAADRMEHMERMKEHLSEGEWVLCDRYFYSSLAYNGGLVSYGWVEELNRPAIEELPPDLVIFLDVSPEAAMLRVDGRSEQERYERLSLQRQIRRNYLSLFSRLRAPVAAIPGEGPVQETQEKIRTAVMSLLEEKP